MKILLTRWKSTYRAIVTDDDGRYRYEVSANYDRKGRLYINGTLGDVGDGALFLATARIIADAARAGLSVAEVLELLRSEV